MAAACKKKISEEGHVSEICAVLAQMLYLWATIWIKHGLIAQHLHISGLLEQDLASKVIGHSTNIVMWWCLPGVTNNNKKTQQFLSNTEDDSEDESSEDIWEFDELKTVLLYIIFQFLADHGLFCPSVLFIRPQVWFVQKSVCCFVIIWNKYIIINITVTR